MAIGRRGGARMKNSAAGLVPHKLLATTDSIPLLNWLANFTRTESVDCPKMIVEFTGGVHVYVTPGSASTSNVTVVFGNPHELVVMNSGVNGT
jgi:hypothetical protein